MKGYFVKTIFLLLLFALIAGCSEAQIEEFAFRKTLEYDLVNLCEDEEVCIAAVKSQIKGCMEKSEWRRYLDDQDNEEALKRFSTDFYACIVDDEGNPYFVSNL